MRAVVISFQPNNSKQKLFSKGNQSSSGFVALLLLALLLMIADYHYGALAKIRSACAFVVSPLQYAVDYPLRIVGWAQSLVGSKKALMDENMHLRLEQNLLEAKMQNMLIIKEENSHLKALLQTASQSKTQAMAAQILAVDTSSSRQVLVLDKGQREGVYVGQPVLDAKGIMGQVIDVGFMTSTVLLISDAKSAVPVRNNRTGERAILAGMNSMDALSLINLPKTSSIHPGDLLVTSGLGRRYPEGYPVGKVTAVKSIQGEPFVNVEVAPISLLNRNRLVLLIWPDAEQKALSLQINERLTTLADRE